MSAAITQEYIDQDNLLPGTSGGTLESDGLVLAAVADAASSPMKRQLAQQKLDQEPSTSQALEENQDNSPLALANVQEKSQISAGPEDELCEVDPNAEPEPCSSADSLVGDRIAVTEEEVRLLKEFAASSPIADESKEERRRKSFPQGILKLASLVNVRKEKEEDKNKNFGGFLPEAVRLSELDEDQREGLIFEVPEEVDCSKFSWTFNPKGRKIGVLPVDDLTVVKTIPLPFAAEGKMTKFDKFVWMHDRYMQFVSCELFGDTLVGFWGHFFPTVNFQEYNKLLKDSFWLHERTNSKSFLPLSYKEKKSTRLAPSAVKILTLVQEVSLA